MKKVCKLSQLHAFSFLKCKFEKFQMTAKVMCLRNKVAQLNNLSVGKEITGIPSRPSGRLQHLEVFCIRHICVRAYQIPALMNMFQWMSGPLLRMFYVMHLTHMCSNHVTFDHKLKFCNTA